MIERDSPFMIAGGVLAVVAAAAVAWVLLRPDPDGLREVVTVDAAGDTLVYSGPVRDAIARARIVEAFNSVAVALPDSAESADRDSLPSRPIPPTEGAVVDGGEREDAGRSAREAAVDALARLYGEGVEPAAMLAALNLAIIDFETGSAALPTDAAAFVQAAAEVVQRAPDDFVLVVTGHAEDGPDGASNLALSEERARAVVAALVRAGVAEDRLRAVGHGAVRTREDGRVGEGHVFFELEERVDEDREPVADDSAADDGAEDEGSGGEDAGGEGADSAPAADTAGRPT